nr:RNB domain-containing ribonuclease [Acetobacter fallax]
MTRELPGRPPLIAGTRVLARLRALGSGRFEGRTLRVLDGPAAKLTGLLQSAPAGYLIDPVNPHADGQWHVAPDDKTSIASGEFVTAIPIAKRDARVTRILGRGDDPGIVSQLSIADYDLPEAFPENVDHAANACETVDVTAALAAGRQDRRTIPFITVDGPDSRDFDDAIWADRDGDGFRLIVAIADVAHYVRPGSAPDREARQRGLSVYFTDRVIPMLPPELSDDLCSLRPGIDRLCVAFDIRIDSAGHQRDIQIQRCIMRSRARLTYDQLQSMYEGAESVPGELPPGLIETLYAAHATLSAEGRKRGALSLERNEYRVSIAPDTRSLTAAPMAPLESHRLIENFMVQANLAAARTMKSRRLPGIFRIHPAPPDPEMVRANLMGEAPVPEKSVLPAASYSSTASAHFALALDAYAHVTSPIRRYADLVCHRALLGEAENDSDRRLSGSLTTHLDLREARAGCATRDAQRRLLGWYLSRQTNRIFTGYVTGETPFGALVSLTEPELTGLLVSDPAVCENMASDLNRISKERPESGMLRHASSGQRIPKKGTAVRVRPIALREATFQCIFALADRQP